MFLEFNLIYFTRPSGKQPKESILEKGGLSKKKMDIFHSGSPTKEQKQPPISLHVFGHGDTMKSDKKKTSHENIEEFLLMFDRWNTWGGNSRELWRQQYRPS